MQHRSRSLMAWVSVVLIVLAMCVAHAQSGRGTIRGRVTDASGEAIPSAAASATNQDTGVVTTANADARGLYALLNLPVGRYTIAFAKAGFAEFTQRNVSVGVETSLQLDATLQIDGVTDTIRVTADAGLLPTQTSTIGTALQNEMVTRLPLSITSGRSIENFAYAIVPGVEGTTGHRTSSAARRSARKCCSTARPRRSRSRDTSASRRRRWRRCRSSRSTPAAWRPNTAAPAAASSISRCALAPTRCTAAPMDSFATRR